MNELELKLLWQKANEKIEKSFVLHRQSLEDITKLKVQHAISSMKPAKFFSLVVGFLWIFGIGAFLGFLFINAYRDVSLFFLYSGLLQVLITALAVGMYALQLDLIYKIDYSESVLVIQKKIIKLEIFSLHATRVLFLQLPLWTTFYLSESMIRNMNFFSIALQVFATAAFLVLAIWLFVNIRIENSHKRWFKLIFRGVEWEPIANAKKMLSHTYQV